MAFFQKLVVEIYFQINFIIQMYVKDFSDISLCYLISTGLNHGDNNYPLSSHWLTRILLIG